MAIRNSSSRTRIRNPSSKGTWQCLRGRREKGKRREQRSHDLYLASCHLKLFGILSSKGMPVADDGNLDP
ncbi:hypothetical protein BQ8482_350186 [Mesorhizobium delmotii]|uniref:Uncharacterized protein n=1 Tax=Mesorhizobium delmotii TaxID=1631247 RepID=A0A2P9AR16_9HYPH|nr:hypothetical protein BQ8482_350186 [Mesorhizobium delmotii]